MVRKLMALVTPFAVCAPETHCISPKQLERYVGEFTGRNSMRGLPALKKMRLIARRLEDNRLGFRELVGREALYRPYAGTDRLWIVRVPAPVPMRMKPRPHGACRYQFPRRLVAMSCVLGP